MKRNPLLVVVMTSVIVLVLGAMGGYYLSENSPNKKLKYRDDNTSLDRSDNKDRDSENLELSLTDKKIIGLGTMIEYKTIYLECGHEIKRTSKPEKDMLSLTQEQLEGYLANNSPEWFIEEFSKDKVVIYTEKNHLCPNHFIIGEKNGKIVIFKVNEKGEKVLHKILKDTSTSTLKKVDQEKLKEGIVVNSEEEAGQILENFIS